MTPYITIWRSCVCYLCCLRTLFKAFFKPEVFSLNFSKRYRVSAFNVRIIELYCTINCIYVHVAIRNSRAYFFCRISGKSVSQWWFLCKLVCFIQCRLFIGFFEFVCKKTPWQRFLCFTKWILMAIGLFICCP